MTTKVLVSGDARGDLATLFGRVGTLHASKGPFDCLLCVGDFFGPSGAAAVLLPYRSKELAVPLPCYILGTPPSDLAGSPDADGKIELAPNIYCLAGAGMITLHALRVAFASGRSSDDADRDVGGAGQGAHNPHHGALTHQVEELRNRATGAGYVGCDLLLTHEWPRGWHRKLPDGSLAVDLLPDSDLPSVGAERVAEMVAAVRPRYHFCGSENAFFARPPFRQLAPSTRAHAATIVSRLVALANVGNADKKQKWLHALSLVPIETMSPEQLAAEPENTTDSPYPHAPPRVASAPVDGTAAADAAARDGGADKTNANSLAQGGGAMKRKRPEYATDARSWVNESCWFCLASPQFESHFVVSVGEETYVCLAKGPLLPMHALILPIAHTPCSLFASDVVAAEVDAYVSGLRRCFEARGAKLLLFERFTDSGSFEHMHLQALPIPAQLAAGAREAFESHGKRYGLTFEVLPPGERVASRLLEPEPFFAATLPSGETLLHRIRSNPRKHPLQFGRETVAAMLGNPRRADWKNCLPTPAPGEHSSTKELEGRMASDFKQAFAAFDPAQ